MKVNIFDHQPDLSLSSSKIRKLVKEVIAYEKQSFNEVSLHFVDIKTISALHNQYFQDPTPTDCISFPMDDADHPGYRILGEVFVCPKIALEYAAVHEGDAYTETALYIIHGLLHLMGYDDLDPINKRRMRRAEKKHMKHLQDLKLYLT